MKVALNHSSDADLLRRRMGAAAKLPTGTGVSGKRGFTAAYLPLAS